MRTYFKQFLIRIANGLCLIVSERLVNHGDHGAAPPSA